MKVTFFIRTLGLRSANIISSFYFKRELLSIPSLQAKMPEVRSNNLINQREREREREREMEGGREGERERERERESPPP